MKYLREILHLTCPMLLANIAMVGTGVVDTLLLGHYASFDLAVMSLSIAIYSAVFAGCIGILQGFPLLFAEAYGANDNTKLLQILQQGIVLSLLVTMPSTVGLLWCAHHLDLFQIPLSTAGIVKGYIQMLAFVLPLQIVFRMFQMQAQACGQAYRVMWFNGLILIIKGFLSWLLIFGQAGLPSLGAIGAISASLLTLCLMLPIFVYGVPLMSTRSAWKTLRHMRLFDATIIRRALHIGIPTATIYFADTLIYSTITLMVAKIGIVATAANQIIANFGTLAYFIPTSLGSACSILVSQKIGEKNLTEALAIAKFSFKLNAVFVLLTVFAILFCRESLAHLYTSDMAVQALVVVLLTAFCFYHFFDAQIIMMMSLLRCWHITIMPMVIYIAIVFVGSLTGGSHLAHAGWQWGLSIAPMGAVGFWVMLAISTALAFVFIAILTGFILRAKTKQAVSCV